MRKENILPLRAVSFSIYSWFSPRPNELSKNLLRPRDAECQASCQARECHLVQTDMSAALNAAYYNPV